jgi:hypothetical protein
MRLLRGVHRPKAKHCLAFQDWRHCLHFGVSDSNMAAPTHVSRKASASPSVGEKTFRLIEKQAAPQRFTERLAGLLSLA